MSERDEIEIIIRYRGIEKSIRGSPERAISSALQFLSDNIQALGLVKKLTLSVDTEKFLSACQGVFAITPEGVVTLVDLTGLSDRDVVLTNLVRARFANLLGKTAKDTLLATELGSMLKKGSGTVAGRLSEMHSEGLVERVGKGEYRATTFGVDTFLKTVIPKLKRTG